MEQLKTDTGTTNKKEAYFCERKEQSANNILGKSSSQVNFGPNKMIIVLEVKKKRTWGGGGCVEKRSGKNRKMEGIRG